MAWGFDAMVGAQQWQEGRRADAERRDTLRQRIFDRLMRERDSDQRDREFEQRKLHDDENRAALVEQRQMLADQRRQNAAHTMAGDLSIGDALDPEQLDTLRAGRMGSNVEEREATLPSKQSTGFLMTGAPGPGERPQYTGGRIIAQSTPGSEGGTFWKGTPAQRQKQQQQTSLEKYIEQLPPNDPVRRALEFQSATGQNPPASMFPNAGDTTPWQAIPLYGEDGRPSGALRFNQRTGQMEPVELPEGSGIRAGTNRRGQLPPRVQNWILSLQQQHPNDYAAAQREFAQAMQNAPDEAFDRMAAAQALRGLYAQPSGADDFTPLAGLDIPNLMPGGSPAGGRVGAGRGAAPAGSSAAPQVGERRQLRDGRTATITRVFPDGTVEVEVEE